MRHLVLLYFALMVFVICKAQFINKILRQADVCPDTHAVVTPCRYDPHRTCLRKEQCPEGYNCCPYGCDNQCLAVTVNFKHPGSCPINAPKTHGLQACSFDVECKAEAKCCGGFCFEVRQFSSPVLFIRH